MDTYFIVWTDEDGDEGSEFVGNDLEHAQNVAHIRADKAGFAVTLCKVVEIVEPEEEDPDDEEDKE